MSDFFIWFTDLMRLVNSETFYIILIFVLMFGIDFKRGFVIMHIYFWITIFGYYLKDMFNLPRPMDVDESLNNHGGTHNGISLDSEGTHTGFFSGLPKSQIEECRAAIITSPGFPSVKIATSTAVWLSIWQLFRKRWLVYIALAMILFTTISSLFLAENFLAGIIGGIALGFLGFVIVFLVFPTEERIYRFIHKRRHGFINSFRAVGRILYFFVLPLLLLILPQVEMGLVAKLLGINFAYYFTGLVKWPSNGGYITDRIFRVLIAVTIYFVLNVISAQVINMEFSFLYFIINILEMFITFLLTIWFSNNNNLFKSIG